LQTENLTANETLSDRLSPRENFLEIINESFEFARGRALPLGAALERGGINFSVFSEHATGVTLVLYRAGATRP
jgi:isoamylase